VQEICRAFDVLPGPTGIVAEGCWLYANPALLELAGRALVGTPAIDIDARRWRRADGSTVAVEVAARSIELDGRTACVLAISDRSASEQLSERLAQSEDSFRAMLDASPDAMFVHGDSFRDYQVLWANAAMLRLLGYDDLSELVGRASLDAFVHPDDRDVVRTNRIRLQTGGAEATLAFRWVTRAGQVRHVSGTRRRLQFGGQSAILVIARDRTEELEREHDRAAAEAALRESEARYRLLFDGSPVPICVFDAQTFAYVAVNQKMLDTYGYTREEFLRMTVKDVKPAEDLPDMIGSISASPVGEQRHIGVRRHRRKDGAMLDMDITSHQLSLGGQRYSLAIGMDVTEQRRIEDQLRQAAKMEAIGQLAGGVAHDFNNLLAVILATTEFLRDGLGAQHALAGEVNEIESAAQRAARLTRQLLAFSRKQPHTPKVLALRGVVGEIEKMLRRILGEDIDVVTRLAPCGQVAADAGQLEQVLMNLAVNARDAMPRGGRLVLETTNVELDASRAVQLGLAPGPYAVLAVTERLRHVGGDAASHLRAVLHDQGGRARYRPRPGDGVRHRAAEQRRDRGRLRARARLDVSRVPASRRSSRNDRRHRARAGEGRGGLGVGARRRRRSAAARGDPAPPALARLSHARCVRREHRDRHARGRSAAGRSAAHRSRDARHRRPRARVAAARRSPRAQGAIHVGLQRARRGEDLRARSSRSLHRETVLVAGPVRRGAASAHAGGRVGLTDSTRRGGSGRVRPSSI
jgi:PAS domain S-box-containing protein